MVRSVRLDVFAYWVCVFVLRSQCRTVFGSEDVDLQQTSSCTATVDGQLINLQPLDSPEKPRLTSQFTSLGGTWNYRLTSQFTSLGGTWNYTYNPCTEFSIPENPYDVHGDHCLAVSVCKYAEQKKHYYFTMGFQVNAVFQASPNKFNNSTAVSIVFNGYRSMEKKRTLIRLVCDRKRTKPEDALFTVIKDERRLGDVVAELHHLCSCLDGCPLNYNRNENIINININETVTELEEEIDNEEIVLDRDSSSPDRTKVLIIVGVNIGVILMAGLVGLMCYNKKSHLEIYHKLPGNRAVPEPTLWQLASSAEMLERGDNSTGEIMSVVAQHNGNHGNGNQKSSGSFRDGEPNYRRKSLCFPVLEHCGLPEECITMGQRLGGGIFGDTYKGQWTGVTVAVKRITLSVHPYQVNADFIKSMQKEVGFLSQQRHRNIVAVLGYCSESKHPYIISEFITGQVVKDFVKHSSHHLTWPHRVKILSQVADGMAFLHSTDPVILHRDLRCANMFITNNDVVKVCDFGIVKLTQSLRSDCQQEDCACQGLYSACPPSIAWTAPEVLEHPNSLETDGYITSAADVYSYAIVMWELIHGNDPYEEMHTAPEVIEHVLSGGRPELPAYSKILPVYLDLMRKCWHANPTQRCSFKQVTVHLKEIHHQAKLFQKALNSNKGARPKTRTLTFSDEVKVKEISKSTPKEKDTTSSDSKEADL